MNKSDKTLPGGSLSIPPPSGGGQTELPLEQHVTSLPLRGAIVAKVRGDITQFNIQFQWTVRFKVIEMTPKKAAILLKILIVQLLDQGIDFTGYLAVEMLVSYLLKGKTDPIDIREEKDRQACLLGILLLSYVRGNWINLGSREPLPPEIAQEIFTSGWLPDKRTFASWRQYYDVRSFIEILTVPLDLNFERDNAPTIRYSSYTKHYGNGGHISRVQKTPYDSELDGEESEAAPPSFALPELSTYSRILLAIEKAKIRRESE